MLRLVLLLLLLLTAVTCHAQTAVHHCVSANGTPVFTDQPCNAVQSRAVGTVGAASNRAQAHHACPATRKALKQRITEAFSSHDANALAGLMLWRGYSDPAAVRYVNRIRHLMRRPLLSVDDAPDRRFDSGFNTPAPGASSQPPMAPEADIQVELGGVDPADGPVRYTVMARAGCFWLLP